MILLAEEFNLFLFLFNFVTFLEMMILCYASTEKGHLESEIEALP